MVTAVAELSMNGWGRAMLMLILLPEPRQLRSTRRLLNRRTFSNKPLSGVLDMVI